MDRAQEIRNRTRRVLHELEKYGFEEIVAYEHPLHAAVRELECYCMQRIPLTGFKTRKTSQYFALFRRAAALWFALLRASRRKEKTAGILHTDWRGDHALTDEDIEQYPLERIYAWLYEELEKWLEDEQYLAAQMRMRALRVEDPHEIQRYLDAGKKHNLERKAARAKGSV